MRENFAQLIGKSFLVQTSRRLGEGYLNPSILAPPSQQKCPPPMTVTPFLDPHISCHSQLGMPLLGAQP